MNGRDTPIRNICVLRFSAMGDAAMCVPVIRQCLEQNPTLHVTFVSNRALGPLVKDIPRLTFHPAELKGGHKGMAGLTRLFRELRHSTRFDAVADLHDVLRSKYLSLLFRLSGVPVRTIDKGRREKKALTRRHDKAFRPLPTTFERYARVFRSLGLPVVLDMGKPPRPKAKRIGDIGMKKVGIAPFAKHLEKTWPEENAKGLVRLLLGRSDVRVLLFGGGRDEAARLESWKSELPGMEVVAGLYSLEEELGIVSTLDLMVSMDSANMHLASLFGVPVVSVWGATHPFAGFMGWGQSAELAVQADIGCRPCSVFGNKGCYKGTRECLTGISPHMVYERVILGLGLPV
jgi:ADP-heptose:LPS heptosyltransferase